MLRIDATRRLASIATLLVAVVTLACHEAANGNAGGAAEPATGTRMQILDAAHRTVTADVKAGPARSRAKFVIVEVAEVTNPRRAPLDFIVGLRRPGAGDVTLGTFALYPPDNPGRFIVSTQGKVTSGDELILTLDQISPDNISDVRIGVRAFYLGER